MNLLKKWYKTILILFKNTNQHGFGKYCLSGKCPVCKTPWPKIEKTPMEKYLNSIGYYDQCIDVKINDKTIQLPKGMMGQELINLKNKLKLD